MCLPEEVGAASGQQLVVRVVGGCTREGGSLTHHDEEDNRCCEQIYLSSLVRLTKVNLWRHVAECAQLRVQQPRLVMTLRRCCKAKVSDLEVEGGVKHEVLRLQISVAHTCHVHILERIDQLVEEPTRYLLREAARIRHIVKQLTTCSQLQHDVVDCLRLLIRFFQ